MNGWISVHRQLTGHWIWQSNEPYDKRSAWIDLLLRANYEPKVVKFRKKDIEIERGQTLTSITQLSERWKWSRHKVSNFLDKLEKANMLVQVRDNNKILISIEKYDVYQTVQKKWDTKNEEKTAKNKKDTSWDSKKDTSWDSKKNLESIETIIVEDSAENKKDTSWDTKKDSEQDTNNNNNNIIYFNLLNKYITRARGQSFGNKVKLIAEIKKDKEYDNLSNEEQNKIFYKIMGG